MFASARKTAGRAGIVATAIGAGAAALVLTAPMASAEATDINVAPSLGSSQFGTGCTYDVTVAVNAATPVYLYDNGVSVTPAPVQASGGTAPFKWTPTTPGAHTLTAYQGPNYIAKDHLVQVGNGINLGSACVVL
ncbi:hypothetical protein OG921_21805 [Aldersonia sp. NBC_00410]|uniref:hypothetical protein n=1 Tax=Aldersonia sp. NBC_00410 TaxID=2975954 RepID=UPI002251D1BA|nr:hypothetical protein [Aldersonia sp. NBC_00410]MCX5045806.1 hypothetical protein [Aldersonia sp. NBC_00410]